MVLDVLEREAFEHDVGFGLEPRHHRVAELAFAREVAVDRALVHSRPLGHRADRQRPPVPDGKAVQDVDAGGDDALARFRPLAGGAPGCRTSGAGALVQVMA